MPSRRAPVPRRVNRTANADAALWGLILERRRLAAELTSDPEPAPARRRELLREYRLVCEKIRLAEQARKRAA